MDVFVLNFPTKRYKDYVDATYSFCAIVVRSTVNFDVQGDQRAHAWLVCILERRPAAFAFDALFLCQPSAR